MNDVEATRSRSVAWLRDEIILALDLYMTEGPNASAASLKGLSDTLRSIPIEESFSPDSAFRSSASVRRKLGNFRALDPSQTGGLPHGSSGDASAWDEFASDPVCLHHAAEAIRTLLASPQVVSRVVDAGTEDEDFAEAEEGQLLTRLHRVRERNRKLVAMKKGEALASGSLQCEVCEFEFGQQYGDLGVGFIECHHTVPVSELAPGQKTRLDDFALVSANC